MLKKIFLYVGHSNWGKSFVLKSITDNNSRKKIKDIAGNRFRVRKMSNDDNETKLLEFVKSVSSSKYHYHLIAYCPRQEVSSESKEILDILSSSGELFFFIQKMKYGGKAEITTNEISSLEQYGRVEVLKDDLEYSERAARLKEFIHENTK